MLQGAAQGVIWPSFSGLVAQWSPPAERSVIQAFPQCGGYLGNIVFAALIGWQVRLPTLSRAACGTKGLYKSGTAQNVLYERPFVEWHRPCAVLKSSLISQCDRPDLPLALGGWQVDIRACWLTMHCRAMKSFSCRPLFFPWRSPGSRERPAGQ